MKMSSYVSKANRVIPLGKRRVAGNRMRRMIERPRIDINRSGRRRRNEGRKRRRNRRRWQWSSGRNGLQRKINCRRTRTEGEECTLTGAEKKE